MAGASLDTVGGHLAVALAAGALATKDETGGAAIRDRFASLKRGIVRRSTKIDLEGDLAAVDRQATLAKELDEHGAANDGELVTKASELLGLIKVDEAARTAVEPMIGDIEKALVALSEVDIEPAPGKAEKAEHAEKKTDERPSQRKVEAPTTSRRAIPADEPSKTELERTALPIYKRTDRFFMKAGILGAALIALFAIYWGFIRTPSTDAMDHCRDGEAARCWQEVAAEDSVDDGRKMAKEPLELLCDKYKDPCGCAGLAYVKAAEKDTADCSGLTQASGIDPMWPCTCKPYNFWKWGRQRTPQCGIPRCE